MDVHHLNCMSFNLGYPAITHCVLLETEEGLALVDSGLSTRDYTNPSRFMDWFMALNKVPRDMEETAIRQVADLGYAPEDVRHIVLTHMHIDHTGGLPDFPWAKVHVYEAEYQTAISTQNRSRIREVGRQQSGSLFVRLPIGQHIDRV